MAKELALEFRFSFDLDDFRVWEESQQDCLVDKDCSVGKACPAAKSDNLNSTPRTYVTGENRLPKVVL